MTEASTNGSGAPTITAKDLEVERGHAQHFKNLYEETSKKFKDVDLDKYNTALRELNELKNKSATSSNDPKQLEERIAEKEKEIGDRFQSKLEDAEKRANEALNALKHERATKPALAKISTQVTHESQLLLLEPIIKAEADMQDDKVIFKGEDGKPRYSKERPAELMGIEEYTNELKTRFPGSFKSDAQAGTMNAASKTDASSTSGPVKSISEIRQMGVKEQQQYFNTLQKDNPAALDQIINSLR